MAEIDKLGGSVACVDNGFFRDKISDAAYSFQKKVETGETVVVGVNKFKSASRQTQNVLKVDANLEKQQIAKLNKLKESRDKKAHETAMADLQEAAERGDNIVEPVLNAVENYATIGEISDVFRKEWKEYREQI